MGNDKNRQQFHTERFRLTYLQPCSQVLYLRQKIYSYISVFLNCMKVLYNEKQSKAILSVYQGQVSFTQESFVPSLVQIGPVVL